MPFEPSPSTTGPAGEEASSGSSQSSSSNSSASASATLRRAARAVASLFERPPPRHDTHVPLSVVEQGAVAFFSALGALRAPQRGDLVAAVGETTAGPALGALRERLRSSPTGRRLLRDRPRVTDETLARARRSPPGSFGAAYARFMGERGFRADERPPVRFVGDPEMAWVMARSREVHDFWHVLFDCHTNVFGETALKALECVQTGLPMTAAAVVGGSWRMRSQDRGVFRSLYLPWALRAGARAADLLCVYYEECFDDDLEAMRRRYRILVAPSSAQNDWKLRPKAAGA